MAVALAMAFRIAAVVVLLACSCPAQTTAPAVEGAYEHNSLRRVADSGAIAAIAATGGADRSRGVASEPAGDGFDVKRVLLSLSIVLGLIFVCRWAARWAFPSAAVGRSSQVMRVLSRSVIAPRQQLLLIQVGRRLLVAADCGQQMSALSEITDPDEVAALLGQLRAEPPGLEAVASGRNPFAPLLDRAQSMFAAHEVPPAGDGPDDREDDEDESLALAGASSTRGELDGLTEKIRLLSRQLGKP
jgi:flagellar biogenesis protein FliO